MFTRRSKMITRRRKGDNVRVTFTAPDGGGDGPVYLAGSFTGWERVPMKRQRDGQWKTTVELEPGHNYEFRYVTAEEHWLNDPDADYFLPTPLGNDNSVIAI
jgi:1,4-alpha-glucan branching enzyme